MEEYLCVKCKSENFKKLVGNVFHTISGKPILVLDVPHFWCEDCSTIAYMADTEIKEKLKYAFKNDFNVILWG